MSDKIYRITNDFRVLFDAEERKLNESTDVV